MSKNHLKKSNKKVKASFITLSDGDENLIAKKALISQVTPRGFDMVLNRHDLVPSHLKFNINLNSLCKKNISLYIPSMEIDLEGTVIKTNHLGRGVFKISTEFFKEFPKYWGECLSELWPKRI